MTLSGTECAANLLISFSESVCGDVWLSGEAESHDNLYTGDDGDCGNLFCLLHAEERVSRAYVSVPFVYNEPSIGLE